MISRRYVLFWAILTACTNKETLEQVLPQRVEDWTRGPVSAVSQYPPALAQSGVEEAAEAVFTGPSSIRVRVFRMRSETNAFEALQQWRHTEGLAVYKGPYFLVAEMGPGQEVQARRFLTALQSAIRT